MRRTERSKRTDLGPQPSIAEPRPHLLKAVLDFVLGAANCRGVKRIAMIGSLTTCKPIPKDADVLVTLAVLDDLAALARLGRRLKGEAQRINLGADIFLADPDGHYLGRICGYRECHSRVRCRALNCTRVPHLNDDLQDITLARELLLRRWKCGQPSSGAARSLPTWSGCC